PNLSPTPTLHYCTACSPKLTPPAPSGTPVHCGAGGPTVHFVHLMAPTYRPRTSERWAIQPTRITGIEATVAVADRCARYSPSWGTELIKNIGMVAAFVTVRLSARNSSFHAKITQISAVDTSPGETMGKITPVISLIRPAPCSRAASSSSWGTSSMKERIITIAIGTI